MYGFRASHDQTSHAVLRLKRQSTAWVHVRSRGQHARGGTHPDTALMKTHGTGILRASPLERMVGCARMRGVECLPLRES